MTAIPAALLSISEGAITEGMKALFCMCMLVSAGVVSAEVRPPAVAGAFYSDDAEALRSQVESLLAENSPAQEAASARALVVPHAGFVFSGPTAAKALTRLPSEGVRRVILLGPSHHFSFKGGALPDTKVTGFATPLGTVALDLEALKDLRRQDLFDGPSKAHPPEHSLEVQLPFLQVVVPGAKLVPVLVGNTTDLQSSVEMAKAISDLIDEGTVVIASSDFTHHGDRYGWSPYEGAELAETLIQVGRETAERAAAMDTRGFIKQVEVSGDSVCGVRPIGVLTALLSHAFDGTGEVLDVTTSGKVSGNHDLSVTYAAVAFSGNWTPWKAASKTAEAELEVEDGQAMIALVRAALKGGLTHDTSVAGWFASHEEIDRWLAPAGAFVTLHNTGARVRIDGRLRACMGVVEAKEPLIDAVIQAAVMAAQDPRFPPLTLEELDEVEIEVSVLSPMRPASSYRFIEPGVHGVLMAKNGRRALYLPQVATEQGWNRDEMLDNLSLKAGLERKSWQHGARFEVFTAQVFTEDH